MSAVPIENAPKRMSCTAPDPLAMGLSNNAYCALLPKRRYAHEAKGRILFLPSSGLTVVPFQDHGTGWDVVVVEGTPTYHPDGYCLFIGNREIETAIERGLVDPAAVGYIDGSVEDR